MIGRIPISIQVTIFVQVTSVANNLKSFDNVGECLIEMLVCIVSFSPPCFAEV